MRNFSQKVFSGFAGKIGIVSLMAICFALFSSNINAQTVLVNYDFSSAVASVGTAPCNTGTPLTTAPGVTSTFTVGGTGVCTTPAGNASTVPPAFVANASNQAVSIVGTGPNTTNFFQFRLDGVSSFSNFMVFFQAGRSSTGAQSATLQYSTDGTTFTDFQTVAVPINGTPLVLGNFNFDLSSVTAINRQATVFFRIVGSGASSSTGTFRIDNFQVQAQAPTAATVNVGGRVTNSKGRGIFRAVVSMTDGSGNKFVAYTNSLGYYRFEEVEAGQTLIFNVRAKGYNFTQPTQLVSLNEEATTIDFKAYESRAF